MEMNNLKRKKIINFKSKKFNLERDLKKKSLPVIIQI